MIERRLIAIQGIVQGVGFRPFVMSVARALDLRGSVRNDAAGVLLDIEGETQAIGRLIDRIRRDPPPLASVESIVSTSADRIAHAELRIAESDTKGARAMHLTPDAATCAACVGELFDPCNRRYRHPFITCTNCGPRLTISCDVPYDRERTTMAGFAMCAECRREYSNPSDRRYHAQPIACWNCGPTLRFQTEATSAVGDRAIAAAVAALREGRIIAVKGLGGYHLASSALDAEAVQRLRARKARDAKPFAIMVRDVAAVHELCEVSAADATLLMTPMSPIVLLAKRAGALGESRLLEAAARGNRYLGVMLPYSPVHHLLLSDFGGPLVMTSGNRADEPIAVDDTEALERLGSIADAFLLHDRPIATRCDDSVVRGTRHGPVFVRRSRGAAPAPLRLHPPAPLPILAVGGHLKNTFCFVRNSHAYFSQHIGDLENARAYGVLVDSVRRYGNLLGIKPEVVAHDLHPNYLSTRLAREFADVEHIAVQHHHAHVASCLAEHNVHGSVLGIVFDGAGYGSDGAIWGGEFLLADQSGYSRIAHVQYVPLPGGDAAARQPWRMAAAHLWRAYGKELDEVRLPFADAIDARQISFLLRMIRAGIQSPPTSSVGRLFDAIASIIGLRHVARYEAQAAIELEAIADLAEHSTYPTDVIESGSGWIVDVQPLIRGIMQDVLAGQSRARIAGAFHNAVRDFTVKTAELVRRQTGVRRTALTGGVFQNALLSERIATALEQRGFEVLIQRRVPCNDGGLALGQAAVAARTCNAAQEAAPCV